MLGNRKRHFIVVIGVFLILVGAYSYYLYQTSVDVSDAKALEQYIENEMGEASVKVLKTSYKDDFCGVYYQSTEGEALFLMKAVMSRTNRYRYFGYGKCSTEIGTFQYNESGSWSLIVVYGDNTELQGASYTLQSDGRFYTRSNLGDTLVDIYIIENTASAMAQGTLYSAEEEVLLSF